MTFRCSRSVVFAGLFFIFVIAFVFTPYWSIGATALQKAIFLSCAVGVGLAWAFFSSSNLSITIDKKTIPVLAACVCVMLLLNLPALTAELPWRGDEDYHIAITGCLANLAGHHILLFTAPFVLFAILFLFRRKKSWPILMAGALLCAGISAVAGHYLQFSIDDIVRYPFILRYPSAGFVIPVRVLTKHTPEFTYRIVPFVSSVLLVWLCASHWSNRRTLPATAILLAVATMPLLLFYSSILYLELPAVLLLTLAFFRADALLVQPLDQTKTDPGWIALVMVGMFKETTITLLAAFLVSRAIIRGITLVRTRAGLRHYAAEGVFAFCTLLPLAVYLWFRNYAHVWRVLSPYPKNVFNSEVYATIGRAFAQQFDLCLVLAIAGLIVLAVQKRFVPLLLVLCSIMFETSFHVLDEKQYMGYSRFNLMLLPPLLLCVGAAVRPLLAHWKTAGPSALAAVAIINCLHSPINLDGSRKSFWGNYLSDVGEHSYPYRAAFTWMASHGISGRRILWTGLYYEYSGYDHARFPGLDMELLPKPASLSDEARTLAASLDDANKKKFDCVLYHPISDNLFPSTLGSKFGLLKMFANHEHRLFLFSVPGLDTNRMRK